MSFHLNAHNLRFPSQTENLGLWCISNSGEIMGRVPICSKIWFYNWPRINTKNSELIFLTHSSFLPFHTTLRLPSKVVQD